jgi:hypothetical protein
MKNKTPWINEAVAVLAARLQKIEDAGWREVPRSFHRERYGCRHYEADKSTIAGAGLTADQYEQEIRAMAKRNKF